MDQYSKPVGTTVYVKYDNVEGALRKLKKKVHEQKTLEAYREKEAYLKPTEQRKRKASMAKKRWQRKLMADQLPAKKY